MSHGVHCSLLLHVLNGSSDRLYNSFGKSITWIYRLSVFVSVIAALLLTMRTMMMWRPYVIPRNSIMENEMLCNTRQHDEI